MTPQHDVPLLAIETSIRRGTVALVQGERIVQQRLPDAARRHAQTLAVAVRSLLSDSGVRPAEVPLVAVSLGPGSFTGLRVGVMFAKTWAYAVGGRVIGVPTFWATAARCPRRFDLLTVIADAQRGELFTQTFRRTAASPDEIHCDATGAPPGWTPVDTLHIEPIDRWLGGRTPGEAVGGPALPRIRDRLPGGCTPLEPEAALPDAAGIARVARALAERGQFADLWKLEPLYVRRSAAEERAELQAPRENTKGIQESSDAARR